MITLFSIVILLVFSQVVFRYLVHIPIIGVFDEISRFIFVWTAWLAVAYSIRTDSHIRIEIFSNIIFRRNKKLMKFVESILFFIFAIFLVSQGYQLALEQFERGFTSPMLDIPLWLVGLAIPISGVLMVIRLIQVFISLFRKNETVKSD